VTDRPLCDVKLWLNGVSDKRTDCAALMA